MIFRIRRGDESLAGGRRSHSHSIVPGRIYAWSVLALLKAAPFAFSYAQTQGIFSVGLATFAIVMVLAGAAGEGRSAIIARAGGWCWPSLHRRKFAGLVIGLLITIGLIGGAGIGLAYVVPSPSASMVPDKKGPSRPAVAGFGLGH